jgi:hypothetical protein
MATYFFVVITLIIIALLAFALCESKGKNSPNARGKLNNAERNIEENPLPAPRTVELTEVHSNH